jgi:imidazolonepropionase-like amidohydrolase
MKNTLLFILITFNILSQNKNILLLNGLLHTGNGEVIANTTVGISNNKISLIKNSLTYNYKVSEWDTIIDLNNQHIYPGFVAPNSTLGLTEIDAVRATNDFNEVGSLNPHIRSIIAYNVESKVIETVRTNGVLITQATPRGGVISGTSSLLHLSGWNWEDAVVLEDDGIHVNWPDPTKRNYESKQKNDIKNNENYLIEKKEIEQFFQAAKVYSKQKNPEKDLRFDAMKTIFNGNKRVYFHANEIQQLLDIIDFSKNLEIKFPVIIGAYDAYLCSERLKDANIPLMLPRVHSLPKNDDDDIDLPYKLPALLFNAGIKFCLQNEGDMEAMNARNLPFLAGTARAYGLPSEEALKAISLNACEIMGISKDFGSIEIGKNATMFVSKGDALDIKTNDVTLILVNGKFISNSNFQKELYLKYKNKYSTEK